MAVALEGTPSAIDSGSNYEAETTGSDRLAVFVVLQSGGTQSGSGMSLTMGSQSGTKVNEYAVTTGPDDQCAGVFYIKDADIPSGSQAVTASNSGTPTDNRVYCYTFSGVDQTTPQAGEGGESNATFTNVVGFTSVATDTDGMIVGGAHRSGFTGSGDTWSPPTSWTEDFDETDSACRTTSAHYATDGTTLTDDFTNSASRNSEWVCAVFAMNAAAGGGGGTILPLLNAYYG